MTTAFQGGCRVCDHQPSANEGDDGAKERNPTAPDHVNQATKLKCYRDGDQDQED
jgi:hypothetical protein